MSLLSLKFISSLFIPLALLGCSMQSHTVFEGAVTSADLAGKVFGGQQPVANATIRVQTFGSSGYGSAGTVLTSTTTDASGNFRIARGAYTCATDQPLYLTSAGGNPGAGINNSLNLAVAIGNCSTAPNVSVNINEVTTVVTAFALAQFFQTTNMGGSMTSDTFGGPVLNSKGLVMAANHTVPTVVDLQSGTVHPNTTLLTIDAAKVYSLANSLAACVNSTGATSNSETTTACGKLFSYTKNAYPTRPSDTLQAAVAIALNPSANITTIYNLAVAGSPFAGLPAAPNDWTVGVSYTAPATSNIALAVNPSNSANLAIDENGKVWFGSNASRTTSGVAYWDPALNTFTLVSNKNVTDVQNVAISQSVPSTVYAADYSTGNMVGIQSVTNGQTLYTLANSNLGPLSIGTDNSVYVLYRNSTNGAQAVAQLRAGGSTLASLLTTTYNGTSIFNSSNPAQIIVASQNTAHTQSYLEQVSGTDSIFATANAASAGSSGQVAQTSNAAFGTTLEYLWTIPSKNSLCYAGSTSGCFNSTGRTLNVPQGIATDGSDFVWVANSGTGSIAQFLGGGAPGVGNGIFNHGTNNGLTMTQPYGIGIDASGNVWAVNAGCITAGCVPGPLVLSELIGAGGPTITPVSAQIAGGANLIGTKPQN